MNLRDHEGYQRLDVPDHMTEEELFEAVDDWVPDHIRDDWHLVDEWIGKFERGILPELPIEQSGVKHGLGVLPDHD